MSEDQDKVEGLTDELRKLAAALGKLDDHTAHDAPAGAVSGESETTQPAACRYCPICQLIALARGQRTESLDSLVTAATGLLSALTSYVDQKAEQERGPGTATGDQRGDGSGRVERIDLS
ncbi:hypothetical protein EK0264_02015 [Epidermidibacterium keratini]|uniref:Uncharacterized protein n=1 Tax=Epidermidibacterium keratini TaxID=1891644 RepID=A0A7L4YJW4_9ACTN|nr:hypothetical protein [Epidermidibacterium keratini]QHB99182.1 hypothetical protein EK0264_02015 [Epidermidibacterium keratini]